MTEEPLHELIQYSLKLGASLFGFTAGISLGIALSIYLHGFSLPMIALNLFNVVAGLWLAVFFSENPWSTLYSVSSGAAAAMFLGYFFNTGYNTNFHAALILGFVVVAGFVLSWTENQANEDLGLPGTCYT